MWRIISLLLVACLISIFVFPGETFAWPPKSIIDPELIAVSAVAIIGLYYFIMWRTQLVEQSKQEGWINSDITNIRDKGHPYPYFHVSAKEGGNIYKGPNENTVIGAVNFTDSFDIYEVADNENGIWYKIRVSNEKLFKK